MMPEMLKSSSVRRKSVVVGVKGWMGGLLLVLLLMGSGEAPCEGFAKHTYNFISAKVLPAF